jgi:hypothetical protein
MPSKSESDRLLLSQIEASLDMDVLTDAYSDEEIDAFLRAAGGDPVAIGSRGAELGAALLTQQRLAWQETAKAARARMEAAVARPKIPPFPVGDPISAILAAANQAGMRVALRGRKAEETSKEELEKLWIKIHEAMALRDAIQDEDDE